MTARKYLTVNDALSAATFQNIATEDVQSFPVGAPYVSTLNVNPATSLGYGTWLAHGSMVWKLDINLTVYVFVRTA